MSYDFTHAACTQSDPAPPAQSHVTPLSDDHEEEHAAALTLGSRCTVQPGARAGTIKYIGRVQGAGPGFWVGVALDAAQGRNDGSTSAGLRYFECEPGHGTFVRPSKVTMFNENELVGEAGAGEQGLGNESKGGQRLAPEDEI